MAELTKEELDERVAVLRKLRSLLEQQRAKFQEYLKVLEKQQDSISKEDTEAILCHAELEQQVVASIGNLQKVIVPMSELYKNSAKGTSTNADQSLENIQDDLDRLQTKVLRQNEKNRELLRSHLASIKAQINGFKNPYRNRNNVYAQNVSASGQMIEINA